MPSRALRARVEAAERRLAAARTLRFTNDAGTDVVYELEQLSGPPPACILTEYGYTDTPGRWDHWPSGFLASTGTAAGVEGRVVMNAGDIVLPWKEFLSAPVEFRIHDGFVTTIDGTQLPIQVMRKSGSNWVVAPDQIPKGAALTEKAAGEVRP